MIEILSNKVAECSGFYPLSIQFNSQIDKKISISDIKTLTENQLYKKIDFSISELFKEYNKNAFQIAELLYVMHDKQLYHVSGYKNIYDYAFQRFGLHKTTVKNYKNVIYFFYDLKDMTILEKYKNYTITKLILLLHLSHEDIHNIGVTPDMSCNEIKKAVSKWKKENKIIPEEESAPSSEQSEDQAADSGKNKEEDSIIQYKVFTSGKNKKYQFKKGRFITEEEFNKKILEQIHKLQKNDSNVKITIQCY